MLISTKGRYALRVMIDLAENQTDEYISLRGIAQRQEIFEKNWKALSGCWRKPGFWKVSGARVAATA